MSKTDWQKGTICASSAHQFYMLPCELEARGQEKETDPWVR